MIAVYGKVKRKIQENYFPLVQDGNSYHVRSKKLIKSFTSDDNFPYLVSFPRTGSHWLRQLMEIVFEIPSLTRIFFEPKTDKFTCYHVHDVGLNEKAKRVIYLYRNPVDTIYSTMQYHKEDMNDKVRISYYTALYGQHLAKWLILEDFSEDKLILTYEGLKDDIFGQFKKIASFLNLKSDESRIKLAQQKVSKKSLSGKGLSDKQIVNISEEYQQMKEDFVDKYSDFILELTLAQHPDMINMGFK